MDDAFGFFVGFALVTALGWLLGVIGFFRSLGLAREVRALQAALARQVPAAPRDAVAPPALPPLPAAAAEAPVPVEAPAPLASAPAARKRRDWEQLLAAKWGVWLGAAALLLSGVFLVRYASDQGLLGPGARCGAAVLLGAALIAAAEWLRRRTGFQAGVADYAPGALAAGGVSVLFAAAYLAGPLYALLPSPVAFVLLAAAALSGLALSLRTGQLVAAVGLVGAFATPFLVDTTTPSIPGLFAYLLFVAAASLAVVRYTAWVWLGWATTSACAGFVAVMALTGAADHWAPGLFVPATMLLVLALLPGAALDGTVGRRLAYIPLAALGAAGLLLVAVAPEAATRAGVLLLVPLTLGKAATEPRLDRLPWLAALLFLLLVGIWGLPAWMPTGEAVTAADGGIIAVLPGDWVPPVLRPLLLAAAGTAALFVAAGLWGERHRPNPLRWAALAAAIPVLTVAILYARVAAFQPDDLWAGTAVAVAALSTAMAYAAAREGSIARAGIHAAGATAALALGCGAVLSAQWLTVALALFLPALAAIEHAADLPPLRRVALAVAAVAGIRLLLNPAVLHYADGQGAVLNGLLPAYGAAALGFAAAARMFRRRADDGTVAALELGSAAFTAALVLLEVRQWETGSAMAVAGFGFRELALDVSALALLSWFALHLAVRTGRLMLDLAARAGGIVALVGGVGLLAGNPALVADGTVGAGLVLNALLPAYLIPAAVALAALRTAILGRRTWAVLQGYALAAAFAYVTLAVRHSFHPAAMALDDAPVVDAELWAWSGAWLLFGAALMAAGILTRRKPLRLTALAIVALTGAKVFLVDMSGLVGLWRVLSFLGLGLTLIALGAVYRRFVAAVPGEEEASVV